MAGWRDYLGLLPFVRSRRPPAPVKPSVNLMTYEVQDVLSFTFTGRDILDMGVNVDSGGAATRKNTSPLRRIT